MDGSSRASSPMREYGQNHSLNSYSPPSMTGSRADGSYVPRHAGAMLSHMPPPLPGDRPGYEMTADPASASRGGPGASPPFPSYSPSMPGDGGFERASGLGTWSELIAGGVVDRPYIEQEAERRKQEIDRQMDNQLAQLESQCQEQCASVKQQSEYHTQMAEKQIEGHKRQHLAQVARQAELQAFAIVQKAEMEKGRLGQEAYRALSQQSEREKAAVLHEAMRKAEDVWRHSQRQLMEQAQKAKADIDVQAQRRSADIEKDARDAVARVYISPQGPLGGGAALSGAAGALPPNVNFNSFDVGVRT